MRKLVEFYNRLRYTQLGSTAAEYALLITLIALAIAIGAGALGTAISAKLSDAATQINPG
jgi:Flp pilus assembly pilin Flp